MKGTAKTTTQATKTTLSATTKLPQSNLTKAATKPNLTSTAKVSTITKVATPSQVAISPKVTAPVEPISITKAPTKNQTSTAKSLLLQPTVTNYPAHTTAVNASVQGKLASDPRKSQVHLNIYMMQDKKSFISMQPKDLQSANESGKLSEKTVEEFYAEIADLVKVNEIIENDLKNKLNEIKKLQMELLLEKERCHQVKDDIERLENDKKEITEKLVPRQGENVKLNEELQRAKNLLTEKERYITVLVKENDGRLNIAEQFKVFDLPSRDPTKRNTMKRNSTGNTTLKSFQEANKISA
jgi:hypothetical protein